MYLSTCGQENQQEAEVGLLPMVDSKSKVWPSAQQCIEQGVNDLQSLIPEVWSSICFAVQKVSAAPTQTEVA